MASARRLIFLSTFFTAFACAPARDSWLKDVALNYSEEGFLDRDTFQKLCITEAAKANLAECDKNVVFALARYRDNYEREFAARFTGKKAHPTLLDENDPDTVKTVFAAFADLVPGYIVSETRKKEKVHLIYRIFRKNLLYDVHERKIDFLPSH